MKTLFMQIRQFAIARAKSPISIVFCAAPATLSARRFHSWMRTIFLSNRTILLPNLSRYFPPQFGTPPDAYSTTNGWDSASFAPKAKAIVWNGRSLLNTCPQFLEYRLAFGCAVEMLSGLEPPLTLRALSRPVERAELDNPMDAWCCCRNNHSYYDRDLF
jgi:hypothetical protein